MGKNIGIFYFSGTGNTEIISGLLCEELKNIGCEVDLIKIENVLKAKAKADFKKYDIFGIGFPIHAFNAPRIVFDFLKLLPKTKESKKAFIFKTAGGIHFINDAAGKRAKNKLQKRGYKVFHESVFQMPSNWAFGDSDLVRKELCEKAIEKSKVIAFEIFNGKEEVVSLKLIAKIISFIFRIESFGARLISREFKISKKCNNCGICIENCPAGNIYRKKGEIKFGWSCLLCMKCLYQCPKNAITPRFSKYMVLKGGYDIKKIFNEVKKQNEGKF